MPPCRARIELTTPTPVTNARRSTKEPLLARRCTYEQRQPARTTIRGRTRLRAPRPRSHPPRACAARLHRRRPRSRARVQSDHAVPPCRSHARRCRSRHRGRLRARLRLRQAGLHREALYVPRPRRRGGAACRAARRTGPAEGRPRRARHPRWGRVRAFISGNAVRRWRSCADLSASQFQERRELSRHRRAHRAGFRRFDAADDERVEAIRRTGAGPPDLPRAERPYRGRSRGGPVNLVQPGRRERGARRPRATAVHERQYGAAQRRDGHAREPRGQRGGVHARRDPP